MKTSMMAAALAVAFSLPAFADDARSVSQEVTQKWKAAYDAGDAAALTKLYLKDAAFLPQGATQPIKGEGNIRKFYEEFVKNKATNLQMSMSDAKMIGSDMVLDVGSWTGDIPGENGAAATRMGGTYLAIVVRDGGEWRYLADTWNMATPAEK